MHGPLSGTPVQRFSSMETSIFDRIGADLSGLPWADRVEALYAGATPTGISALSEVITRPIAALSCFKPFYL
jgi:hypothetical protein